MSLIYYSLGTCKHCVDTNVYAAGAVRITLIVEFLTSPRGYRNLPTCVNGGSYSLKSIHLQLRQGIIVIIITVHTDGDSVSSLQRPQGGCTNLPMYRLRYVTYAVNDVLTPLETIEISK